MYTKTHYIRCTHKYLENFLNNIICGKKKRAGLALVLGLVDYDAIIINWTANDDKIEAHYKKGGANEMKEVFETLVRSALALPKNPALILFEDYGRRMFNPEPIAEEVHHAIAR